MSKLNGQELEIFRAGPHGIKGKRVFTRPEIQQIAQDYGTDGHEAPIVIGHPKLNSPAFGWWKSLRADGDVLYGTPNEVHPALEEAVQNKQFKKRSAAFDPLPGGKWQLRHVGFLGGTPPVVKGLADATFATDDYLEFEYSTEGDGMAGEQLDKGTLTGWLREAFADLNNKDKGTQVIDVPALEQRLAAQFADQLKTEREAREAAETRFADFQKEHHKGTQSAIAMAAVAQLKQQNKWLPAFDRMGIPELFAAVAEGNTESFEFADSKDTKKKLSPIEALASLVGGISKFVPTGVTFGDEQAQAAAETKPAVPETNGGIVDLGSVAFDADVRARMSDKKVDYPTAVQQLRSEGKSSSSYAQASAGSV